ncbi:MAG: hypothetical protein AAGB12_01405 [Pseudomonadota bacterium]
MNKFIQEDIFYRLKNTKSYVILAEVPEHHYTRKILFKKPIKWHLEFNVAAWIRVYNRNQVDLHLAIHYQDDENHKETLIETNVGNDIAMLFSGVAKLTPVGNIHKMSVVLKGINNLSQINVEELLLQRNNKTSNKSLQPHVFKTL